MLAVAAYPTSEEFNRVGEASVLTPTLTQSSTSNTSKLQLEVRTSMKAQACVFKVNENDSYQNGIALLNSEFGRYNIVAIVDQFGTKLPPDIYNYELKDGPLCYIAISELIDT